MVSQMKVQKLHLRQVIQPVTKLLNADEMRAAVIYQGQEEAE
jgi:hypothetical protein